MKLKMLSILFLSAGLLSGCNIDEEETFSDAEVIEAVKCTNQQCYNGVLDVWTGWGDLTNHNCYGNYCFESKPTQMIDAARLTRFKDGHLIPVYFREKEDPRFVKAMDEMERLAGYKLFDRMGVVDIDISDPEHIDLSGLSYDWGFILSEGTAPGMIMGNCSKGTVSTGPYTTNTVQSIVDPDDFSISYQRDPYGTTTPKFAWVNIDSLKGANGGLITCNARAPQDVAIHEFAHAMGMVHHFLNFGEGDAWGSNAERVFKTMYRNPQGTAFDALIAN
ncbi:hypothetical protein VST7929_00454 [Vibrio stylophorae]|uniref:Peptidase M43 pregnancy-associated plasma-A domain-containing protein n=1 Tax=Vibrio stylophorae TaxID=659351 RepID=A0ABM8ZQP2_9VIBR|nr:hypothetical protein [Vibrio stylophorae]CAH0532615.1 hypothetical protein VST7929_00454 [Vibrio stylophorae]